MSIPSINKRNPHITEAEIEEMFGGERCSALAKQGYVYFVQLSNGLTKVGFSSRSPGERLTAHRSTAMLMGASPVSNFVSNLVYGPRELESLLIKRCAASYTQAHGREWYWNADSAYLKEIIECWPFHKEHELCQKGARVAEQNSEKLLKNLEKLHPRKEISVHGHEFQSCYQHAKVVAALAKSGIDEDHPGHEQLGSYDITNLEMSVWLTLYESPHSEWPELFRMAQDSPTDFANYAAKVVRDLLQANASLLSKS